MSERETRGSVRGCLAVLLAALAAPAPAAETWLHPVLPQAVLKSAPARRGARPARPSVPAKAYPFPVALSGESSFVELTKGERFPEPASAVPAERIDRTFVRLGTGRPMPLTSPKIDGTVTRLEATWAGHGLATLGVLLTPEARTIEAAEFEAFLEESGAKAARAERTRRKETRKGARTVTLESARSFAGVADLRHVADPTQGTDDPLGLPLEIVATVPPLPLRVGSSLWATVLLDGKPAPGAVVRAYSPGNAAVGAVLADANGSVVLPLEREGRLLLATATGRRTVKADRLRGEAFRKADWEVRRTTLELLVLPKAPAPAPKRPPKGKRPAPGKRAG
jgi:hypothetical protein